MASNDNQIFGRFWISKKGKTIAGKGRIELLKKIKETGSISKAAKLMAMSYKAAWDSVDIMNKLSDEPLVKRIKDGKQGGGTILTDKGNEFIDLYDKYSVIFNHTLKFMEDNQDGEKIMNYTNIKTSAENSFVGNIIDIEKGAVSAIIKVKISDNFIITSSISNSSVDRMDLKINSQVCCLINSNQITVMEKSNDIKISARNIFKGVVKTVKKGAVNSEVEIELNKGNILNVLVTNESVENMQIAYGLEIIAFCKASSVVVVA